MRVSLNEERARVIGRVVEELGPGPILRLEEADPQYAAVKSVAEALGKGPAMVVALLTALSTYRLTMMAEDYWRCFSSFILKESSTVTRVSDAVELAARFLRSCPGARMQLDAKIRRVKKAASAALDLLSLLIEDPDKLVEVYKDLTWRLARGLGQRPNAKTIAFAVKMAYYAYRERGLVEPVPISIPIPVDVRVACSSYSSGLVDAPSYREIVRDPAPAQEGWALVSRVSGIPEVHLDALAWSLGAIARDDPTPAASMEQLLRRVGAPAPAAQRVAREFSVKRCR
jgi:DNA-(apurinic or apyrimidinic site) lyase